MQEQRPLLASAFAAIAVSFGLGRYGIGLFLPDMARAFDLSDADLGFLASAGWAGYVVASLFAMLVIASVGAGALVAGGLCLSVVGMGLISVAETPTVLYLGTILTGISPGLVFAPVADAITARFEPARRGPAFAVVNAGEGAGTVAAGLIFLTMAPDWRMAWLVFSLLAIASAIASAVTTPRSSVGAAQPHGESPSWRTLFQRQAWPLLGGSFVVGASTTVLWTFAGVLVDGETFSGIELRVVLWIVMGAAGVAAIVVAPILEAFGLRRTYAASIVVTSLSAAGLALAANAPGAALLAGAVFSFAYIMITSQIGAWALSIWPQMPAAGFGFTFLMLSMGAVAGPAVAGMATAVAGLPVILVVTGLLTAGLLALLPEHQG
jgi:predicted MFS family arabinose efflux permease